MSLLRPLRRADRKPQKKYLDFIRSLQCVCCQIRQLSYASVTDNPGIRVQVFTQTTRTEAGHTGPHAMGSKSDDRSAIPVCMEHHREGKHSYHKMGEAEFLQYWGINLPALLNELHSQFETGRSESLVNAQEACL